MPDDVPFVKAELSSARHLRPGFSVFSDTLSGKMLVDLELRSTETLSSESAGCPLLCCFLVE